MSNKDLIVSNLELCWSSIDELLGGLTDDEWQVQSLCPDWTVAGIIAHLAAIEQVLSGWFPADETDAPPFDKVGPFMAEAAALSGGELRDRFNELVNGRRGELAALSQADFDKPSITPVGLQTYGRFMAIRVFDFWVHEHDIRSPLGKPGHEGGPAAEMAIDEIEGSMGYIVGKKIGLGEGKGIAFHLSGPVERDIYVAVDGRAQQVASLDSPDATVTADSTTFAQLACGRIDPEDAIAAGRVSWSGDEELGAHAARNLRFTM